MSRIRGFINVRAGGLKAQLETTNCSWCGNREYVCTACAATAGRMRLSLARTAAKCDARKARQIHAQLAAIASAIDATPEN